MERTKSELVLIRPIYTGFCVSDMSKALMYEFHYYYVKQNYHGDLSRLLFTHTDSLVYKIQTNDLYHDLFMDSDFFDFKG